MPRGLVLALAVGLAAAACMPAAGGRPSAARTAARGTATPTSAVQPSLTVIGGFEDAESQPLLPPDAAVAAGPSALLVATNGSVWLHDRTGQVRARRGFREFFNALVALTPERGITDPRALFDRESGRFFLAAVTRPFQPCRASAVCASSLLLAVSNSSFPQGLDADSWHAYETPPGQPGAPPPGIELDFPAISVTQTAVVVALNIVVASPPPGTLSSSGAIRVVDKATVIAGRPLTTWTDLDAPMDEKGNRAAGLQPAIAIGPASSAFVVGIPAIPGTADVPCQLIVWSLTGPPESPSLTARSVSPRFGCAGPPFAPQAGSARQLSTGGTGLSSRPVLRNGSLWITRSIGHDFGSGPVPAVHWLQLDVRHWPQPPTIVQESLLGADGVASFFPALMALAGDALIVGFAQSSRTQFASVAFAGRLAGDAPNALRQPVVLKSGSVALDAGRLPSQIRYGDEFDAALDPSDGTAWLVGEFPRTASQPSLWVGHVG
jgi:hypothetical protein